MLDVIKKLYGNKEVTMRDNMVLSQIRPHTRPVAALTECCSGTVTAEHYFWARYFDKISDEDATAMVKELKKLQITDKNSHHFGCMRWYREETFVTDSNGAFFVLLPMAVTYRICFQKMTAQEKSDIEELLKNALVWFKKEISGSIFYSNKIMSDGAMVALISSITDDGEEECNAFWEKWLAYADERGMGWGENVSDGYSIIMTTALNIASLTMKNQALKKRILEKRQILLDYMAFHGGKPMVPSIRTYNFDGDPNYGGALYKLFEEGKKSEINPKKALVGVSAMTAIIAYESGVSFRKENTLQKTRNERVFDSSYAYTWKGDGIRLGTVSKFPAMPNCYQRDTWGLGWQSMPACALIEDVHIAFLRMQVKVGESTHNHPATDKHNAFLWNRLFEDGNLVTVGTTSAQENGLAIVGRHMKKLANTASAICDQWCIPKGFKSIEPFEAKGIKWHIVTYESCALAIAQLGGFAYGYDDRAPIEVTLKNEDGFDVISAGLYEGDKKPVFAERLESVWAVAATDDAENVRDYVSGIEITDKSDKSDFVPESEYEYNRTICLCDGKSSAKLVIVPGDEL